MSILLATGVSYELTVTPAGPLTQREVDRFIVLLDSDDWFGRLVPTRDATETR